MSKKLVIITGLVLLGLVIPFALMSGGTALNGQVIGGHYYLGSHGHFREVSPGIYFFSAILSATIGVVLPIYAFVFTTWQESRKPTSNRWWWLGPLLASLFGLILLFSSVRCLT